MVLPSLWWEPWHWSDLRRNTLVKKMKKAARCSNRPLYASLKFLEGVATTDNQKKSGYDFDTPGFQTPIFPSIHGWRHPTHPLLVGSQEPERPLRAASAPVSRPRTTPEGGGAAALLVEAEHKVGPLGVGGWSTWFYWRFLLTMSTNWIKLMGRKLNVNDLEDGIKFDRHRWD